MSFIKALDGRFIRDTLPKSVRLASDKSVSSMEPWESVPEEYCDMADWAAVVPVSRPVDVTRPYKVVYLDDSVDNIYEFSGRLYGFLGEHNLDVFGTWDGQIKNAPRATQFLHIESGTMAESLEAQVDRIVDLKMFITSTIRGAPMGKEEEDALRARHQRSIKCERRMFNKVSYDGQTPPSVITARDDPMGRMHVLHDEWRVTTKPAFGRRDQAGRVTRCSQLAFRQGDFVSVQFKFDIAMPRKAPYGVPVVCPHIYFTHVVQLCREKDVGKTFGGLACRAVAAPRTRQIQEVDNALVFDGDVADAATIPTVAIPPAGAVARSVMDGCVVPPVQLIRSMSVGP